MSGAATAFSGVVVGRCGVCGGVAIEEPTLRTNREGWGTRRVLGLDFVFFAFYVSLLL